MRGAAAPKRVRIGEELAGLGEIELSDPIGPLGVLIDYVGGRIQREVRPERITLAHPELGGRGDAVADQVKRLRDISERLLREHRKGIVGRGLHHKRIADSIADIYARIAVLSRVSAIIADQEVEPSGQERYIA